MENSLVGQTDPICPNCLEALPKMPGRQMKCKKCGEYLYVRTRPQDKRRVLVNKSDAELIDKLWMIEDGTYENHLEELKRKEANPIRDHDRKELSVHLANFPGCVLEGDSKCQHTRHRREGMTPEKCNLESQANVIEIVRNTEECFERDIAMAGKVELLVEVVLMERKRLCSFDYKSHTGRYSPAQAREAIGKIPKYCLTCYSVNIGSKEILDEF